MPESNPTAGSDGTILDDRFEPARKVLEDAIRVHAFPGCAFGVFAQGHVRAQEALGRFTYEPEAPRVTPETAFDIASLTKVVSTTPLAMLLHQQGLLDLDQPLGKVLPEFVAGRAEGDPARRMTLRHLLAHNSGLPGYVEFFRKTRAAEDLMQACLTLPLQAEPGTKSEYSDPGFILLGQALERLSGRSLSEWFESDVARPLELKSTQFNPPSELRSSIPPTEEDTSLRKRTIQGEVQDENAYILGGVAGHAGLFSNVPDLLRFSAEILAADSGSGKLFSQETLRTFAERQGPAGSSRALGWDTPSQPSSSGRFFSARSIGHLGYSGCSLWIDLDAAIAIVLLTNRTWPDRSSQFIKEIRPAFNDAIRKAL